MTGGATQLQAQATVSHFAWVRDGGTGLTGIDTRTLDTVTLPGSAAPGAVAYSPDGRRLYVAEAGAIAVYHPHPAGVTRLRSFPANLTDPRGMVITTDGSTAYVTDVADDLVLVVDLVSETVTATIVQGAIVAPEGIVLSPDETFFYVTTHFQGIVQVSTATRLVTDQVMTNATTFSDLVVTPDHVMIFGCAPEATLMAWFGIGPPMSGPTGIDPGSLCRQLAISPDGSRLFVPLDGTANMAIVNAVTGQVITTVDLTETSDRWAVDISADGSKVIVAGRSGRHVIVVDAVTGVVLDKVDTISPSYITGRFLSPSYLVPGNPLDVSSDADLTPVGFRDYVTMAGGGLRLLASWTTAKNLSSIQESSHLDTNGFDASIAGTVQGDFTKNGLGTLTLSAVDIGTGNVAVEGGVLNVTGTYSGNVRAENGGAVRGNGIIGGHLDARAGSIVRPGGTGPAILIVGSASFATGSTLQVIINALSPSAGYSQVDVYGATTITGGTLDIELGFTPAPGDEFTILTNRVSGTFTGLPEGSLITMNATTAFRITYTGGDGNDVVLTVQAAPTIGPIAPQTIDEDATLGPLALTIGDVDTAAGDLIVTASSSNQGVVDNSAITIGGTGLNRTISVAPRADESGSTTITVTVSDELYSAQTTFPLTVNPVNDAPAITAIAPQTIAEKTSLAPVTFTVSDIDTNPSTLTVTASSSNQTLVPDANLTTALCANCAAPNPVWTIAATPAAGQAGMTTITVTVSDGDEQTSTTFVLTVTEVVEPTRYYLAEGATGPFFDTDLLIANPNGIAAPVTITFLLENGASIVETRTLAATSRTTIHADQIAGLEAANFSTVVVSTDGHPLAVERTMRWDASGYGAHTEKATNGAASTWYFAEGAQGYFSTYLLLANPQQTANVATVTWMREGESAVVRNYPLAAASRTTIDASLDAELVNRSFGARVAFDQPGMAERAMYFGSDPAWLGGHAAAGATAPSTSWYLAEGATGSYFTTFVLIANPGDQAAEVTLTYLPESGDPVTTTVRLGAGQRMTRNIAEEHASLASASVATSVSATQPIVVERAQYWGSPAWIESHNSLGVTAAGRRWALAEGRVGGADGAQTYILLANPGTQDASVTLTFLRVDGGTIEKTVTVPAARRVTVGVTADAGGLVPELTNESFGTRIDSTQPIVVERSLYSNGDGLTWAAGTNATATALPEPQ